MAENKHEPSRPAPSESGRPAPLDRIGTDSRMLSVQDKVALGVIQAGGIMRDGVKAMASVPGKKLNPSRAVNSAVNVAKRRAYQKLEGVVEKKMYDVYTQKIKFMVSPDRRVPWMVRGMMHEVRIQPIYWS